MHLGEFPFRHGLLVMALLATPVTLTRAEPPQPATPGDDADLNLLDAMRNGLVDVQAEGDGDGRMTVSVTNKSQRRLNVVLPPGLVASGATGQFGGMGGMGGGMGMGGMGMGGMGGGMGGMGGGMGGMGGGMGMGGMGGMGRGRSGTMPPMMGMMMLGRLIMQLCGDYDSWDQRSLASSMMGMGGMGMRGGMGGMMGGMGGMGMGMRSVHPTGLPYASLKPGQTRKLPTRLVSLTPPAADGSVPRPAEGEPLMLGDASMLQGDPRAQDALRRLSAAKAPTRVAQMAMWNVAQGYDWETIEHLAAPWGNHYELTLAREFVKNLDEKTTDEPGRLLYEVVAADEASKSRVDDVVQTLRDRAMFGLWAQEGVPEHPDEPAVACKVQVQGDVATVRVAASGKQGREWVPFGKFTVLVVESGKDFDAIGFTDAIAEGVLERLVQAKLVRGPREKGKPTYRIRIDNASPLILNGLAIAGEDDDAEAPRQLVGIGVAPRRSMTVPASEEAVEALGLTEGVRVVAADLSSL